MKSHSFTSTELKFLVFHSICFLGALLTFMFGLSLPCLFFILLMGLSLPGMMLAVNFADVQTVCEDQDQNEAEVSREESNGDDTENAAAEENVLHVEEGPQEEAEPSEKESQLMGEASEAESQGKEEEQEETSQAEEVSHEETLRIEEETEKEISQEEQEMPVFSILPDVQTEEEVLVDIKALCEIMIREFAVMYGIKLSQIQIICEGERLKIYIKKTLLLLILRNLMDNAAKYVKCASVSDARFVLTLFKQDSDVLMIFRNDSPGVPAEEVSKLTELNYQGANRVSGTGLGLFQAEAAVKALQGSLQIKSSPQTGFTVYLQLPSLKDQKEHQFSVLGEEDTDETA